MKIVDERHAARFPHAGDPPFLRLLELLPTAAYTCDSEGRITAFNPPAAALWGRQPKLHDLADRYCGSFNLFTTEGDPVPHSQCWMARSLQECVAYHEREIVIERPDGSRRTALAHAHPFLDELGRIVGAVNLLVDVTELKRAEAEVRVLNAELEQRVRQRTAQLDATVQQLISANAEIKTLRGLVNLCAWCKKIRDEQGEWQRLETYLVRHTEADISHTICPACMECQLRPDPR